MGCSWPPDILTAHRYGHRVESAFGDDDVGVFLRRFDELLVHGFDGRGVLRDDRLHRATAFADVAQDTPRQPNVRIGVHIDLDIHQVAQLPVLEDQDAVHDNHLRRLDQHGFRQPVVVHERVHRVFDRYVLLERLDMVHHHLRVERLRMVVVEFRALLVRQFGVGLVVEVVAQRGDIVATESFLQTFYERRFSRAGSSGHTDYGYFHGFMDWVWLFSFRFSVPCRRSRSRLPPGTKKGSPSLSVGAILSPLGRLMRRYSRNGRCVR